jgi:hypothetical protein
MMRRRGDEEEVEVVPKTCERASNNAVPTERLEFLSFSRMGLEIP